jgi:hypothetical protein
MSEELQEQERALGERIYAAINAASNNSERSKYSAVGISELGICPERTRRKLAGEVEGDRDALQAFIGTAIGDHVERAVVASGWKVLTQQEVRVTLRGDQGEYELVGHPDIIDPDGLVIDAKTSDGIQVARRAGPSQQQLFQRHLYAKAAHQAGLFTCPLEQVRTANVWIDRSGETKNVHVHMDHYSEEIVEQATWWLDEVVYAYVNGQPAHKEPPREWCRACCGFFKDCRQGDTSVSGLITNPELLVAVAMQREGMELEKRGRQLKAEAKAALLGVQGNTPDGFSVNWVHVNESVVREGVRAAHDKLMVTKLAD